MVLQGDADPGVQHDEDHSREEGVLLRVQAQNYGNDMINTLHWHMSTVF